MLTLYPTNPVHRQVHVYGYEHIPNHTTTATDSLDLCSINSSHCWCLHYGYSLIMILVKGT